MFTDARTNGRTDARTPDRPVYYKLTFEPSAQVSKKKSIHSMLIMDPASKLICNKLLAFGI